MPMTLDERIAAKMGKHETLAKDDEVHMVCTWNQPNTSEVFDESRLDREYESSLSAFFALDEAAARLIKSKSV